MAPPLPSCSSCSSCSPRSSSSPSARSCSTRCRTWSTTPPGYIEDAEGWINRTFGTNLTSDTLSQQLSDANGPVRTFVSERPATPSGSASVPSGPSSGSSPSPCSSSTWWPMGPGSAGWCARSSGRAVSGWCWTPGRSPSRRPGGYIYSRGLLAILSGLFHWAAFEIIGIKYAIALAVWVGLTSQFIPVVGTYMAAALPILIALASSPLDAVWVLAFATLYQQVENYLFAPRITARTMSLHPAVAFGTVIAGAGLIGPIGAILALPAAAVIQAVGSTYIERHPVVDTHMTEVPEPRPRAHRPGPAGVATPEGRHRFLDWSERHPSHQTPRRSTMPANPVLTDDRFHLDEPRGPGRGVPAGHARRRGHPWRSGSHRLAGGSGRAGPHHVPRRHAHRHRGAVRPDPGVGGLRLGSGHPDHRVGRSHHRSDLGDRGRGLDDAELHVPAGLAVHRDDRRCGIRLPRHPQAQGGQVRRSALRRWPTARSSGPSRPSTTTPTTASWCRPSWPPSACSW